MFPQVIWDVRFQILVRFQTHVSQDFIVDSDFHKTSLYFPELSLNLTYLSHVERVICNAVGRSCVLLETDSIDKKEKKKGLIVECTYIDGHAYVPSLYLVCVYS